MPPSIVIPLQVMGIGIVISYGIALLIQVLVLCIRRFNKEHKNNK